MTDLEITKLCAEAMGIMDTHNIDVAYNGDFQDWPCLPDGTQYDPLENDDQALALVNKFHMGIDYIGGEQLNRAICERVAKMQFTKHKEVA